MPKPSRSFAALRRRLSPRRVARRVAEAFAQRVGARRPDGPEHPLRILAICGVLSLLLWLVLTLRQTTTATIEARTVVATLPSGEALVTPVPETVRLVVEGTGYRLLPLFSNPPRLPIAATQREVFLDAQLPALPPGVRLVGVSPRTLRLDTEPSVTRTIPVVLRARIAFVPSYNLSGAVRVSPDSVRVTGARSVVAALRGWPTAPLPLGALGDTLRADIALLDTLDGLVAHSESRVRVVVPVAAFSGQEREVEVRVTGAAPGSDLHYAFDPPSVRVRFRVRLGQGEAALRAPDFYATVDADELRRDATGLVRVRVHLPAGLDIQTESVQAVPTVIRHYRVIRE